MAAASFPSIPSTFKPPQRILPPRRRPNQPLPLATRSNQSYFIAAAAAADQSYFAAAITTDQSYFAAATATDQSYFADATAAISSHLLRSLPPSIHPSVKTPILRLLSSPCPPSIAPPLCLAASQLIPQNPNPNSALNAACALHLIHAVAHARTSAALTRADLMSGDALLAFAYEMVARMPAGDSEGAARVLKVLMEVAETAVAVAAAAEEEEEGEREGRLAAGAAACGVRVGGGDEEEVERAKRVGMLAGKMEWRLAEKELGLGFQQGRTGPVRRLLQEMILKQDLEK